MDVEELGSCEQGEVECQKAGVEVVGDQGSAEEDYCYVEEGRREEDGEEEGEEGGLTVVSDAQSLGLYFILNVPRPWPRCPAQVCPISSFALAYAPVVVSGLWMADILCSRLLERWRLSGQGRAGC